MEEQENAVDALYVSHDPMGCTGRTRRRYCGAWRGTNTWTNNNTYILDGIVYVGNGTPAGTATLSIEKGTVIRGRSGSALVATRSSDIFAWGTAQQPVIFTADVLPGESLAEPCRNNTDRGLWGGVIMLGRATVNVPGGTAAIEVLPPSGLRTRYGGGANPQDGESSGVLRYVSIRHPGQDLGAGADVNGLTLGGVGSGTTLPVNGFFETTQHLGAFDTAELWLCAWTALDAAGYLPDLPCN
jgi:hypothetical protein